MKKKILRKKQIAIVLSIFAMSVLVSSLMVGAVSAHILYLEANDKPDAPSVQAANILFGHPNTPEGNKVPSIKEVKLYRADYSVVDLKPIEKANHAVAYFLLNQRGVHLIAVAREPGVYDPAWHNHTGPVQLIHDFAKIVIRAREEEYTDQKPVIIPWAKVIGQELEIIPLVNPLSLHVGDTFKAALVCNDIPIQGVYSAAHATQSIHNQSEAQIGETAEDGTFPIEITEPGMWQVVAEYTTNETGTLDEVAYEQVRYRATLTLYALP